MLSRRWATLADCPVRGVQHNARRHEGLVPPAHDLACQDISERANVRPKAGWDHWRFIGSPFFRISLAVRSSRFSRTCILTRVREWSDQNACRRHAPPAGTRCATYHGSSQASTRSRGRRRSERSNGPSPDSLSRCAALLEFARVISPMLAIQPDAAPAEPGRYRGRGSHRSQADDLVAVLIVRCQASPRASLRL